jgi:hypothetical protein
VITSNKTHGLRFDAFRKGFEPIRHQQARLLAALRRPTHAIQPNVLVHRRIQFAKEREAMVPGCFHSDA